VAIGEPEDLWLLVTDAGYGFTVKLAELITDRKAGKSVLNLSDNAKVLPPQPVPSADASVALVNDEGRLLVLPVKDVPELPRGKGNKLFNIPTKKAIAREETLVAVAVLAPKQKLVVWCGDRPMTLTAAQLEDYRGERAQRGAMLSRNYRKVDRLEVES
jgi:topoisomerase-4 subunit A